MCWGGGGGGGVVVVCVCVWGGGGNHTSPQHRAFLGLSVCKSCLHIMVAVNSVA